MAQPIPLISWQNKAFTVSPEASDVLNKLTGPVAVLAVCGRARQGKSWLLNQLLAKLGGGGSRQAGGFQVGSTQRPCTKGIWLWSAPIQRTTPAGLKYNLVFLDCEGTDAFDQTKDYSTQVFSLGVLLSSMLIFNQLGSIDESSVEALSTVCEFARLIREKSGSGATDAPPHFLWLLRDFHLQLQDGERKLTPREYMEEVLEPKGHKAKDEMRASIRGLFPSRDCAALVRPLADERALAAMDNTPLSALRPEFRQGLDTVISLVAARALPRAVHGKYVTGSMMVAFAQACVKVLNQGGVPILSTTWQAVLASENQKALDAALAVYASKLEAGAAGDVDALDAAHATALDAATAALDAQAMGDAGLRAEVVGRLRSAAAERFRPLKAARLAQAEAHATQLLATGGTQLAPLLGAAQVDLAALNTKLTALLESYDRQAAGPLKYKKAAEFLVNTVVGGLAGALARSQTGARTSTEQLSALEKESAQVRQQLAVAHQQLGASQHAEGVLQTKLEVAEAALAKARLTGEQRAAEVARLAASRESDTARVAALERQLAAVQAEGASRGAAAAAAEAAAGAARQQAEAAGAQVAALRADLAVAQAAVQEAQARSAHFEAQVNRLQAQLQAQAQARPASVPDVAVVTRLDEDMVDAADLAEAGPSSGRGVKRARVTPTRPAPATPAPAAQPNDDDGNDGPGASPYSEERVVVSRSTLSARAAREAAAGATPPGGAGTQGHPQVAKMTVAELKAWLTDQGQEAAVHQLARRRPAPKKDDWVALAISHASD